MQSRPGAIDSRPTSSCQKNAILNPIWSSGHEGHGAAARDRFAGTPALDTETGTKTETDTETETGTETETETETDTETETGTEQTSRAAPTNKSTKARLSPIEPQ